jgi:Tfp pilus assembly PilM family ATPase
MGFFGKTKQEPGWLAIRFLEKGVEFAHIRREGVAKPKLLRCEYQALDWRDPDALSKLRREARLDHYQITSLLEGPEYRLLLVEAPDVPPGELKMAIRWRVKDLIDFHLDDAMIDVVDVPVPKNAAGPVHSMYVVATRNETIQERMALFDGAKLPIKVIDIPEMAERNVAALLQRGGQVAMLLSLDEKGGLLTFTHEGELYLARRIEITVGELMDADDALREQSMDRVGLELQRSLDYFDLQFHYLPLGRLMLAPVAPAAGLREHLVSRFGLNVELINLSEALDLSQVPALADPEQQGQSLRVIGAALRFEEKVL